MKPALKLRALQLLFVVSLVVLFCSIYVSLFQNSTSSYFATISLLVVTSLFVFAIKKEEKRIDNQD